MRITNGKITIDLDDSLTIGEVVEELENIFPDGRWANFTVVEPFIPYIGGIKDPTYNKIFKTDSLANNG